MPETLQNACFSTVLIHNNYLNLHGVCFLFQMEHPSEER